MKCNSGNRLIFCFLGNIANSAAESAIDMEDALISGLLSKLNEDANEDAYEDAFLEKRKHPDADSIYIAKTHGGAMTTSVGSEDAFNALEKGEIESKQNDNVIIVTNTTKGISLLSSQISPAQSNCKKKWWN